MEKATTLSRPDRVGRVLLGTHIDIETAKEFQLAARLVEGKTGAALIKEFVQTRVDNWRATGTLEKMAQMHQPSRISITHD